MANKQDLSSINFSVFNVAKHNETLLNVSLTTVY